MDDPTRHLTEPQPVEPSDAGGYLNPLNVLDLASPTAWINYGIKELTGYDVLESFVKPFSGDWSAYSRYGDALRHLGPAAQDIGVNIQQELDRVDASWEGNANDSAYNYFNNLAARTSEIQHALYAAAAEYEDAARGIWLLAQQMANIIQSVVDEFVIIAAAMAVGTALIETGVGPIVGYGLAAWRIAKVYSLITKASTIIQTGGMIVLTLASFLVEADNRLRQLGTFGIPDTPYDHPAVDWRTN